MKKILNLVAAVFLMSGLPLPAFAAVTMNQPNNGFYEGADPEWSALHAQDSRGTPEHRQYHTEKASEHLEWHRNNVASTTVTYENAHRLFHQERNADHRLFHNGFITADETDNAPVVNTLSTQIFGKTIIHDDHSYTGARPTVRSIQSAFTKQRLLHSR